MFDDEHYQTDFADLQGQRLIAIFQTEPQELLQTIGRTGFTRSRTAVQ